ncbi:MAG: DNA integrity scanning protein DisA nucleotide-binding domain protein, partial [Planctomycetales bacterium]
ERLKEQAGKVAVIVAVEKKELLKGADEADVPTVLLDKPDRPVHQRIGDALLECVASELLTPGSRIIAMYSGFEADVLDSISDINLGEHLERLTSQDLRQLETQVPREILKLVMELAVEIGREGREGKAVGTMFVIGDHRKVLKHCKPQGFDAVKGYTRKERSLYDRKVREGVKEIAQLDGAFIVNVDGTVEGSCLYVDASAEGVSPLSAGLGARHWAAASVSRATKAIAVSVSESSGSVRIFQDGKSVLQIEPFRRRTMKWKDFDYEPPTE